MRLAVITSSTMTHSALGKRKHSTISNSQQQLLILALLATAFPCICAIARGQSNEWVWMGGSNTLGSHCDNEAFCGQVGVYGDLGIPDKKNVPGSRTNAASWTDLNGHLWLFGGGGYDADGDIGDLNDVWEFDPSTSEWAWRGGSKNVSNGAAALGVYGTLRTPAPGNIPGGRWASASWTDHEGNAWLFGGSNQLSSGIDGAQNDLWKFNPSTNEWAWMGGSMFPDQPGSYGSLRTPASGNVPGARYAPTSWIDSNGHLWLFGGQGYDSHGNQGYLNDVWEFDPSTNEWTWMGGSKTLPAANYGRQPGVYGTLGTPAPGNIPGGRVGASGWTDSEGHLWLFGGAASTVLDDFEILNDLWNFDPSANEWAWMGGSNTLGISQNGGSGEPGVYGTLGTPAAENVPGSRWSPENWTDSDGQLWLFGGEGNDAKNHNGDLNDLWRLDPHTREWAWMGGSRTINYPGTTGNPGVYGTLGTPAAGNIPGGREAASTWLDIGGHLWLFGGAGYVAPDSFGLLNDLWEYLPSDLPLPEATPTFIPAGGIYKSPQSVSVRATTPGATIYYTLDGSRPTNKSTKFTSPIPIDRTTTVIAIAETPGYANSAVATAKYAILKSQTIAFTPPKSPEVYGAKPIALSVKASSGLPVTVKVVSGAGKISGHTLTITGVGTIVIAANQAGNADYAAAPQVERRIIVDKASQTIAWPKITGDHPVASKLTLKATASSGLAVTFASETPKVCTVSKTTVSLLAAGACTIRASQPGNAVYAPAPPLTQSIPVQSQ